MTCCSRLTHTWSDSKWVSGWLCPHFTLPICCELWLHVRSWGWWLAGPRNWLSEVHWKILGGQCWDGCRWFGVGFLNNQWRTSHPQGILDVLVQAYLMAQFQKNDTKLSSGPPSWNKDQSCSSGWMAFVVYSIFGGLNDSLSKVAPQRWRWE